MVQSAGALGAMGIAQGVRDEPTSAELAQPMVTHDFIDVTHHNDNPLDDRYYEWIFGNCREHGLQHCYRPNAPGPKAK